MAIVNCDGKALEWYAGTYLSQCPVAIKEILDNVDQHTLNQETFGLPDRGIAKIFVFRLIYGGTAYSYVNDPDFYGVSTNQKYWQGVIDAFYNKYKGWASWHERLMHEATRTGQLVMPTGRVYQYEPNWKGDWPRTTILNYPVQGLGADIMAIARVAFWKRFNKLGLRGKLVSTVHDSIVVDCPEEEVEVVKQLFYEVFELAPKLFEQWFKVPFNIPLRCEVWVSNSMKEVKNK